MTEGGVPPDQFAPVAQLSAGTWFMADYRISNAGIVTKWTAKCGPGNSGNIKLKIFRLNGSNYDFVGESSLVAITYDQTIESTCNIAVQTGDFVGIYMSSNNMAFSWGGPCTHKAYIDADITSSTPTSAWITQCDDHLSIFCTDDGIKLNVYVNSSTGSNANAGDSCVAGHPVLTFANAYSLLASGGTIHVCNDGADFSTETVTLNKSFNIDRNGSAGYFYMPKAS